MLPILFYFAYMLCLICPGIHSEADDGLGDGNTVDPAISTHKPPKCSCTDTI